MDETISASVWNGGEVTETKQDIIMSANVKQEPAEESEGDVGHAVPYGELEITYEPDVKTEYEKASKENNSSSVASSSSKCDQNNIISKGIEGKDHVGKLRRIHCCNICMKTFNNWRNLKVHKRIHTSEKPSIFKFIQPMRTANSNVNLKLHNRIHTGEKPFMCNICMKRFRYESCLNRHKRMHTSEKPSIFQFIQQMRRTANVIVKQEHAEESEGDVGHAIPYGDIDIHEPDIKEECERAKKETDLTSAASSPSKCDQTVVISKGIQEEKHVAKRKRKYCCNICMKTFTKLYHLKAHTSIHTGEKPFVCNICMKRFGHESHLNRHKRIHLKENSCGDQASTTTEELRMNANVKQEPAEESEGDVGHAVPYGDIEITYEPDIKMKCERTSGESNSISVASSSSKCDRSVVTSKGIKKSVKIGGRRHTCNVCRKTFSRVAALRDHERIHTGEKPFVCKVCMKTFNQVSSLNRHKQIHTGKKRFECNICMKTFIEATRLRQHKLFHTGERPFECNICKKTFIQASTLKRHKLIHTGEKPFECNVCMKTFGRTEHLKSHKRIHANSASELHEQHSHSNYK